MRVSWIVGVFAAATLSGQFVWMPHSWARGEMTLRVILPETVLTTSPDHDAQVVRKAKAGDVFTAVDHYKSFYLVKVGDSHSGGFLYIPEEAAEITERAPKGMKLLISGRMAQPAVERDLSYWQVTPSNHYRGGGDESCVFLHSRASGGYATAHNGKKYPDGCYDRNFEYRPRVDGEQLVRDALGYMGAPYVSGGTSRQGIDCSGLTAVCLAQQGVRVVHRSSLQALEGRYVSKTDLEPGDLLFFRDDQDERYLSHVGIYVGNGRFVHSSVTNHGVAVTDLSNDYFDAHYAFARRL